MGHAAMKILLITDGLPPRVLGGTGNIVWQIAQGFAKAGHTVATLSASPASSKSEGLVTQYTIPERTSRWAHYRSVFSWSRSREIMRIIEEVKPDIIHAHTLASQCGYRWIPLAKAKGIPIVLTAHDVMNVACGRVKEQEKMLWFKDLRRCRISWNPLRTAIIRSMLNRHTKVWTVSDALRDFMEAHGFRNLTTLHNGIDTEFWTAQDTGSARSTLNLPQDKTLFLLAGRLGIDKGTDLIARTLPADAHLLLAGRADLSAFKHFGNRVHYFTHQNPEQMRLLYAACDAVLVPSLCLDCFPTVCLEGMSCARPVLATSWGGAKEAVENGKTGWVLNPLDASAWARCMQQCIENPEACKRMGEAGRARMQEHFSLSRFLQELKKSYHESL